MKKEPFLLIICPRMKKKYEVTGMMCAACQAHVEKAVRNVDGVTSVNVSLLGKNMVVDYDEGYTGDPQIIKMNDLYVMLYFRLNPSGGAFDTFACSYDLAHWTQWRGEPLIAPVEPWENVHAHKPWFIRHNGINYHFYCAVNDRNERFIAVAHS